MLKAEIPIPEVVGCFRLLNDDDALDPDPVAPIGVEARF